MAVTVDPKSNKLVIRFRVKGYSKQFYLSTGLKDNKANRAIVESRWELIQREISLDEFDPTLDRYRFGNKKKAENKELPELDIKTIFTKFTDFQEHQLEKTTIEGRYRDIERRIDKFPSTSLNDAPKIRDWILTNYSQYTAWETINFLSRACDWAVNSQVISSNPFQKLNILRPRKKSTDDYKAYNASQRDLIIHAFETDSVFSHYAPLIKFLFWCGCRHGEAFALTWDDISADCTRIKFFKSRSQGILKGTKNGKSRVFPVAVGGKLHSLLLDLSKERSHSRQVIFTSKTGQPMTTNIMSDCWRKSS